MKIIIGIIIALALYSGWTHYTKSAVNTDLITQAAAKQAGNQANKVILYGTAWCPYCKDARDFLTESNIPFTDFDIELSSEGAARYDALDGDGIPVLEVNGTVIHGFVPEEILAALKPAT